MALPIKDPITDLFALDRIVARNSLRDWLVALAIVAGAVLLATLFKRVAIQRISLVARRTDSHLPEALVKLAQATRTWLLLVFGVWLGSEYVELPARLELALGRIATVAAFLQCGLWLAAALDSWIARSRARAMETDAAAATSLTAFSFVGRMVLWMVMLLLALDNLGVNITALAASLGVGGIAVALAVQNILGDLFASLSIVIDKPFVIGDAIAVDGLSGTVENVGLKTTRLRSDSGEQLVFSNSDLLKARLRNYKRMRERVVTFSFGLSCQTPPERLRAVPELVRQAVQAQDKTRFERAHFKEIGASAFVFEVVYTMLDPAYGLYMDTRQAIQLALLKALAAEGLRLAYPTQTIYLGEGAAAPAAKGATA
ncbi:MAG: mechanosensitive ion channel [Nevskia sp.]|nr:mechanosensitive ion channel [Nevskia sp.]